MSENKYQEVFDANVELSEDEAVLAIFQSAEGELSIKDAQGEYRTMAIAAGMVKTPAQKKTEWLDAVSGIDFQTEEGVNEGKAIGADLEIGSATITTYMKAIAKEGEFTLPAGTARKRGNSMSGQLKAWFIENSDATSADIVEKGIELGMTEISAKYYVPIYNTALEIAKAITDSE